MIPQKGGGSHGHHRTTPSYAPVGQGGALIQTRGIFEEGATVLLIILWST